MAPSSISTASTVVRSPVTLSLFKFSHCTSPNPKAKMIWTHLPQRSNIFAVFDVIRKVEIGMVISERKVLKLIRGGELLVSIFQRNLLPINLLTFIIKEQVEFPDLQDQVRMDEESALSQSVPDHDLRVLIIVKRPLLALRYRLPDGQIRKMQMNFLPSSGCDVALENLRAAGLPIRDKDLPQIQGQRPRSSQSQPQSQERPLSSNSCLIPRPRSSQSQPQSQERPVSSSACLVPRLPSSQSQPQSQERPGSLNTRQAVGPQSSRGALPNHLQPLSQECTNQHNAGHTSMTPATRLVDVNTRPASAPGGVNQDEFSRPISASSRSTLDSCGSTTTASVVSTAAELPMKSSLLPSPVFNGAYEPSGSSHVRPMSASEQTPTEREYSHPLPPSQMLPPKRTLPFPEKTVQPFRGDEAALREEPSEEISTATKPKVKRQTKRRAQSARPRRSRAKTEAETNRSNSLILTLKLPEHSARANAPSSSAPSRVPSSDMDAITPSSQPPAPLSINSRKRSLTDQVIIQPNKQTRTETVTNATSEAPVIASEHPLQAQPPQAANSRIDIGSPELLDSIDRLLRKYHDLPAPKLPQTAKEQLAEFAALNEEDRLKTVDRMILECLQDENFGILMDTLDFAEDRVRVLRRGET